MPAATTRSEPVVSADIMEFTKNMVANMEKKIRNLEKRKTKLEEYKAKQASGQILVEEQLKAVARLDDVLQQQELLRDIIKQLNTFSIEAGKQQKKQQRKERLERQEEEKRRLAEVVQLQFVLACMGDDAVRQTIVSGTDGAVRLAPEELNHLDELFKIISPDRGGEASLDSQFEQSAEHLQLFLDAKEKAVGQTTYSNLKGLVSRIKDCSYFLQSELPPSDSSADNATEHEFVVVQSDELPAHNSVEVSSSLPPEVPVAMQIYQPPIIPQPKSLEQIVENVQGRFNFLQESQIDLDSPSHVDPAVLSVQSIPREPVYQQSVQLQNQPEMVQHVYTSQAYAAPMHPNPYQQHVSHQPLPDAHEDVTLRRTVTFSPTTGSTELEAVDDELGEVGPDDHGESGGQRRGRGPSNGFPRGGFRDGRGASRGGPRRGGNSYNRDGGNSYNNRDNVHESGFRRGGGPGSGYRGGPRVGGERSDRAGDREGERSGERGSRGGDRGGFPGRGGRSGRGGRGGYRGQSDAVY